MKLTESLRPSRWFTKDRRGVALVTVLTVMALTTILVLTFFSLATSEHRASYTYSQGLQAQQVAEQAVNLVIAQIREATVRDGSQTTSKENFVWSSQPGAIRLWKENGGKDYAYKLYSDDVMKTKNWKDFKSDFDEAQNWSSQPDVFVDLNEPIIRGEKAYYPIVHPKAMVEPRWPTSLGGDRDGVEGFDYNERDNILSDQGPIGTLAAGVEDLAEGHCAMPVKWIYQLADNTLGVLGAQSGGGDKSYLFEPISGAGTPSAKNPIVARFAFWADDETAKLNMNVHAGGLAWDIPKAGGSLDMAMGKYQPAQHEWQRYPGHPATVHLSPALAPGVLDIVNDREAMEMLYEVVPRVVGGGSESGTRLIDTRNPAEANGLVADKEPLFPSLDDVIMKSDRSPQKFPDPTGKPVPSDELSDYLERARFFVTVNSRAPETNLFNKPRIAMWPIYNASGEDYHKYLTAFDQLIHYCASMGENKGGTYPRWEYVFKRQNADSSTFDYESIPRNQELYAYLVDMMKDRFPGYGDSFAGKYGDESAQQLITMIFDYIRSTNLHDDTLFPDFKDAFKKDNEKVHLTFTNPRDDNEPGFGHKGHGQVTPIKIPYNGYVTKGMGRFYSLSGADILVTCCATGDRGGMENSLYTGVRDYTGREIESPEGTLYTNLPPLPKGAETDESKQPAWLKALKDSDIAQYAAALDPAQWNWQLAFLDESYLNAVMADPTANKFNRDLITTERCENMRLKEGEKLVQAALLFNMFCPSIGWGSINPDMEVHIERVTGMTFPSSDGQVEGFLGFEQSHGYVDTDGKPNTFVWATNWAKPHRQGGARSYGGLLSFGYTMSARQALQEDGSKVGRNVWWQMNRQGSILNSGVRCRLTPIDRGYNRLEAGVGAIQGRKIGNSAQQVAQSYRYDLVTVPFKVLNDVVVFGGGTLKFTLYNGGEFTEGSAVQDGSKPEVIQTVTMEFPSFGLKAPTMSPGWAGHLNEFDKLDGDTRNAVELASLTADPGNNHSTVKTKASMRTGRGRTPPANPIASGYSRGRMAHLVNHWDSGSTYVRPNDILQSICLTHGDARLAASMDEIEPDDEVFGPHRKYGKAQMAHSLTNSAGTSIQGYDTAAPGNDDYLLVPKLPEFKGKGYGKPYANQAVPLAMGGGKDGDKKSEVVQLYGDFDNGAGLMIDGPYINKPDEGNVHALKTKFYQEVEDTWERQRNYGDFPYFSHPDYAEAGGPAYFSPNRIVSGPGMFGSLPSSLKSKPPRPWQTLLFRPNVVGNGYVSHPGALSPPDHLIMDLFWMPVVEPYAISEPLSTAGKINLNFEILPFLHIHRDTALRGVFRSEFMLCVPVQWHHSYKHGHGRGQEYHWRDRPYSGLVQNQRLRSAILENETLEQFTDKWFKEGEGAFKSATEICEVHLVPIDVSERISGGGSSKKGGIGTFTPTIAQMENGEYWRAHALVGDNSRERPYTNIHNRITTKSNTFQVHYRAQVLKQARRDSDSEYRMWRPATDSVVAEYRGSSVVERYVDPNGKMPDFTKRSAPPIDDFYRFRVLNPRRFAP